LVVLYYVTINSIELNANKDRFNGEIIGIGGGAGLIATRLKQ
jgi:glycine betaine/proline transport system substrate-binding protein